MIDTCSKNITDKIQSCECGMKLKMAECIRPDSLTGMIFAAEGIKNTMVLLNGPMGCKFYHSTTSQFLSLRPTLYLPIQGRENKEKVPVDYNYLNDWFFRQPRVPSTALDAYDYVYGTSEKVMEALSYLQEHAAFDLLVIVNSPGASLIGDNLKELTERILPEKNCVMLESPGYSLEYNKGYQEAGVEILKQLKSVIDIPKKITSNISTDKRRTVNLLGMSIWDRYLQGDLEEWKRMLGLCGIEVNCCLFAENTIDELKKITHADLNVIIDPERGLEIGKYLKKAYDMPYYLCEQLPIGFASTEKIVKELCELLGMDQQKFLVDSERARAICYSKINDIYNMCGLPKGASFAVEGSVSQKKAFVSFLTLYMGMIEREKEEAELVFADANTIAQLKLLEHGNHVFCGIEINMPGMGYTDVYPKTQMGIKGAMFLTEQVLNGLMSKI